MAGPNTVFLGPTSEFPSLMMDKLTSMRQGGILTDFSISAMGAKLRCHKLVLSIYSPYFEAMFTTDMVEAKSNSVYYPAISSATMKIILDYCYHERVAFPDDQLIPLITASDFFQIERLKQRCVNEVKAFLNPENVLHHLALANELNLEDVKSWCMEIIVKSFPEVSKQETFLDLTYAGLQECLTEVLHYNDKRDDVFLGMLRWIDDDAEEHSQYLEELLQQVQLDKCALPVILEAMEAHKTIIKANPKVFSLLTKSISNKQLIIIGGLVQGQVSPACLSLNKKENKFVKVFSIPLKKLACDHSVCAIPDGFAVTGGVDSDLCVVFKASSKSWKRRKNMPRKREEHASVYMKDKLYVMCGYESGNWSASVDCLTLHIESGQWEGLTNSPVAVYNPKVAELKGKLHMLDADNSKRLLQLDVEKNVWNELASFPGQIDRESSMIAVNGQLCVAGGSGVNKVCAWYNPASNMWNMGQQKPSKDHTYGSLVQKDANTLLLLGGSAYGVYGTDDIEELNIADESWSLSSVKMPVKLIQHTALYLNIPQD